MKQLLNEIADSTGKDRNTLHNTYDVAYLKKALLNLRNKSGYITLNELRAEIDKMLEHVKR